MAISLDTLSHLPLALIDSRAASDFRERWALTPKQERVLQIVEGLAASAPFNSEGTPSWERVSAGPEAGLAEVLHQRYSIESNGFTIEVGMRLSGPPGSYNLAVRNTTDDGLVLDLRISSLAGRIFQQLSDREQADVLAGQSVKAA